MTISNRIFVRNLSISMFLYVLFASLDIGFTLNGIEGKIALEGNPVMRHMMVTFGIVGGLIIEKTLVLLIALILAVIAFRGIDTRADWVFYLTFTRATRRWMKRKKRYWVAFVPIYFVAVSQGLAVLSWIYIMRINNGH